ncbi:hypothetical protein Goshw_004910 [Gossypium schwendimanii]|uniref:Uncharacterized protein n=3 Tax=Gossypium TaxID=3633 RepID=A0A7J9FEI6_9ROSI|nr:hypothetical protein [Gossypium laxum]MBA0783383.1 hypothetical protein [Gossypium trilobum]MBA0783384.1 hypothetical protein [Gossypium trilobum]MBA0873630.1 hypothetical protein [Gossypium schwendimanii]
MSWRHSLWSVEYQFNCAILVLGNFT